MSLMVVGSTQWQWVADSCGVLNGVPTSQWSIISAAEPLSALAGLVAFGLLPVATIIFAFPADRDTGLQVTGPDAEQAARGAARRAALSLLMPALLTLVLASLLFALVAGELDCRRASVTALPAAGLLGLGTLAMFVAVAWALRAYVHDHETVVAGASWASAIVWAITMAQLWFTIVNTVHHLGRTIIFGIHWSVSFGIGMAAMGVCIVAGRMLQRAETGNTKVAASVSRVVTSCMVALVALYAIYQLAALRSADEWQHLWPGWLIGVITLAPMAVAYAGIALLRALPPRPRTIAPARGNPP